MLEAPQLVPFDTKEQRLYSYLLPSLRLSLASSFWVRVSVRSFWSQPRVRPITPEQDPKIPESLASGKNSTIQSTHLVGEQPTNKKSWLQIEICCSPFQSLQHSAASCSTQFQCALKVNTTTSSAKKKRHDSEAPQDPVREI